MYDKHKMSQHFLVVNMDFRTTSMHALISNFLNVSHKALVTMLTLLFVLSGCVSTEHASKYRYEPSTTALEDVVDAQQRALENDKLLLVVLGAQWCHDSTGLAQRFETKEMQSILMASYETVFVDVGLLEDRRNITQRFDYPIYYATPTVMIVDPATSSLLNRASMAMWGRADSIELAQYVDYFSSFAGYTQADKAPMIAWKPTPLEAQYNAQQASRLQNAYDLLGPQLQRDINGAPPEGFYEFWQETRGYRTELQSTLEKRAANQLENIDNGKAEAQAAPALRHYHPFSWESK